MARRDPLPFDPIDEAAQQWADRSWGAVDEMRAVTNVMRVHQLLLGALDDVLRPHGLTFARYEALVLLTFSRRGALPLGKMGDRLQVHPTSVTSIVDRLEAAGHVARTPHPTDGRTVLAEITDAGRAVVAAATRDLVAAEFGVGVLTGDQLAALSALLTPLRQAAGDFAAMAPRAPRAPRGWVSLSGVGFQKNIKI
jgi:DNA-binding MarR family transcriptional regulator